VAEVSVLAGEYLGDRDGVQQVSAAPRTAGPAFVGNAVFH
jgi:hypothetical protein